MSKKGHTETETAAEQDPRPEEATGAPKDRLAELESRCEELEARWLRSQADYQNSRRRAQQELEAAILRTMQPLLDELLLVGDFLDMALSTPTSTPEARNLAAGVQMTRAKLMQALEAAEVRVVETTGAFDPALHEAAETRVDPTVEPGTILETVRTGFTWQGRILRPARVVVAAAKAPDSSAIEG